LRGGLGENRRALDKEKSYRLAIYIVTSKPKRRSVNAGVVHCMVISCQIELVRFLTADLIAIKRGVATTMPTHIPLPFNEGWLPVGGGHQLYFAEYGQPAGPAAVVLHGGPGSGCRPSMLEWFDLAQQRVVLFDQRGAGRSIPHGETRRNCTQDLVEDIERLRVHLHISRWLVVGGSWGATLALCYAGRYPQALSGLILRGTFLASRREINWFFQSLRALVPDAWARLTQGWTVSQKAAVLQSLTLLLQSDTLQEQTDGATRWGAYEDAVIRAMTGSGSAAVEFDQSWVGKYRVQAHYLSQGCFVSERELFRCARRTAGIPVIVLHGTHDWVCPPENAVRVMRFMPHAELRWIEQGTHTAGDERVMEALRAAVGDMCHLSIKQTVFR
jgi:proline iminopeptidase